MPHYPTSRCSNKQEVMRAIMHELMVEFANEKLRVVELARWRKIGKFDAVNPEPIQYIKNDPSKAFLLLPIEETSANTKL